MGFLVQEKVEAEHLTLTISGIIDEHAVFPPVNTNKFKQITVDLNGIKAITSPGIRDWLFWIKPIAAVSQLAMTNVTKEMIFQVSIVQGFLPSEATVQSFYVPFFCDSCDREESILFNVGKDILIQNGDYKIQFDLKAKKLCDKQNCTMEIDAFEAKYFQFLKKAAKP